MFSGYFSDLQSNGTNNTVTSELITSLQVLETVLPAVDVSLHNPILNELPKIAKCLKHNSIAVRHMASRYSHKFYYASA